MRLNARFHHKQAEYNTSLCEVENAIELPNETEKSTAGHRVFNQLL